MKIRSIGFASLLTATIAAAAWFFPSLFIDRIRPLWTILITSTVFAATYFATFYSLKGYVLYKLKPIYRIIHSKEFTTGQFRKEMEGKKNLVADVKEQLEQWAENKSAEIERLKENEIFRKEYLGNVSHEIKTPIFTIQGYVLTLLDGALEDHDINIKYLERAEKSIERLISIILDMEEISMLESGGLIVEPERFDIVALCREQIDFFEIAAQQAKIKLSIKPENQHAVFINADKKKCSQVISNLLSNSIKYGKPDGATTISFIDLLDKILVEVSDNGIGIEEQEIPHIFERFYRVDRSRSREQGGTGLGLSIVKHIIEAHKETITARSTPGAGTTFSFTMPKASLPKYTLINRRGEE